MTKEDVIQEVSNWSNEKTDYYADNLENFSLYYSLFSDVVDDTYDQFEKEDSNLTFLSIVAGLAESIVRGIPEKDVKYYAMIAVIYDTIQIYQS